MSIKKIYFVRHGATGGNEKNHFQVWETPLSEKGRAQAEFVAKRFKTIPVDVIFSSEMARASETAHAIGKAIGMKVTHSELFHEILRPTAVRGRPKDDPEVMKIMDDVVKNYMNPSWRHSDEETIFDLKARARKALDFLIATPQKNIAVVTHGTFLQMLVALIMVGDTLTAEQFHPLEKAVAVKNTGLTFVEEINGKFVLITLNDFAHLGDADPVVLPR